MAAKIQLNFGKIGTFGGIFSTIDAFRKAGLSNLIDNTLGNKGINTKYTYSHIVENLMATYLCGGECIEDCNLFRTEKYQRNPDYLFASADTILRTFQSLSVANRTVNAESGKAYQFNVNDRLNGLLLDSLLLCGLVEEDATVVFDYDNQFVAAEKYDAKYSYKKAFGYFPGIAQVNLRPFYIENRDGNAQVKLGQDLRHDEQRLRLETPALLVHAAEHGLHDTHGTHRKLLRLSGQAGRQVRKLRNRGDLQSQEIPLQLHTGPVPLDALRKKVAAANLFRQTIRQIETLTPRLLGSNHSPVTPGGGSCARRLQKTTLWNHTRTVQRPRTYALNVGTPSRISKFSFCGI